MKQHREPTGIVASLACAGLIFVLPVTTAADDRPVVDPVEVVAEQGTSGDGGNWWGGHKNRVVRTRDGVFTVYNTGDERFQREWHLAHRTDAGWLELAQGPAGREPANLLADPSGKLYILAWPEGLPALWTGTKQEAGWQFIRNEVPGDWEPDHWPYHGAAISALNLTVVGVSSAELPGKILWSKMNLADGVWTHGTVSEEFRHCYLFVSPREDSGLDMVGVRDIKWETAGWIKPEGDYGYMYNGIRHWRSQEAEGSRFLSSLLREEPQTAAYLKAECHHREVYRDQSGRLHILYVLRGESTAGASAGRRLVLDVEGRPEKDVPLPSAAFWRMLQDPNGGFYLVAPAGSHLLIQKIEENGSPQSLGRWVFPLPGENSGGLLFLASHRNGSLSTEGIDGTFFTVDRKWVYFHIRFASTTSVTP